VTPVPTIVLNGKDADGKTSGNGKLTFDISDIATSSIGVDYSSPDKVVFKVDSKANVKLNTDTKLTVIGNADFNPGSHAFSGGASMEVAIDKSVDAKIVQAFKTNGLGTTSAQVTIKF
jgi:long-subunit fatty acid transport protein